MAAREMARYFRHPGMPGVDLIRSRYIHHTFGRHTHDTYAIGLISEGVEEWWYRGSVQRAGPGEMALVDPDMVHTGHAGVPEGWAYRVLYPSVEVVAGVAAELGMAAGTPSFPSPSIADPEAARALLAAHRAAENGDALAATSLTRTLLALLLRRYAAAGPSGHRAGAPGTAGALTAVRARDILTGSLIDPPSLETLAARLDTGPFALLRAFREQYGLPPHAYLTQTRVTRARTLLDAGTPPAEVATAVGFVDQSHLTRHFKRIVGVGPGAYRQGRRNVQDTGAAPSLP